MKNNLDYSFDDELITSFYYDLVDKEIKLGFEGYFDIKLNLFVEKKCFFTISNWLDAKSQINNNKMSTLDKYLGIINMILYMKYNDTEELEMLINTLDNRYTTLFFLHPQINLIVK